jgi:accessory gene regulator protein AgrB
VSGSVCLRNKIYCYCMSFFVCAEFFVCDFAGVFFLILSELTAKLFNFWRTGGPRSQSEREQRIRGEKKKKWKKRKNVHILYLILLGISLFTRLLFGPRCRLSVAGHQFCGALCVHKI